MRGVWTVDSDDEVPFWRLFDTLPQCFVLVEQCRVPQLQSSLELALIEHQPLVPSRRDMTFRPRGEVLEKAVVRLGEMVEGSTGVWGEMGAIAKGNPRLEKLKQNAISSMVGSAVRRIPL